MKNEIHPEYFTDAKISCACGHAMTVGSTVKNITVEICAFCHPFYTGKQKLVDTAGRVERFIKRVSQKETVATKRLGKSVKKQREAKKRTAKEEKEA